MNMNQEIIEVLDKLRQLVTIQNEEIAELERQREAQNREIAELTRQQGMMQRDILKLKDDVREIEGKIDWRKP